MSGQEVPVSSSCFSGFTGSLVLHVLTGSEVGVSPAAQPCPFCDVLSAVYLGQMLGGGRAAFAARAVLFDRMPFFWATVILVLDPQKSMRI